VLLTGLHAQHSILTKQLGCIREARFLFGEEHLRLANDSVATEAEKAAKLREINKLLQTFTHSLDKMCRAAPGYCLAVLQGMQTWLAQNPCTGLLRGAVAGAVAGAAVGWAYGSFIASAPAAEAATAGLAVCIGTAAAVGAAIVTAGILGYLLYKHFSESAEETHRKRIDAMIKTLRTKQEGWRLTEAQIAGMRQCWEEVPLP
jgi:hypothetical protein